MRKLLIFVCALALSGCAWLGFGDESQTAAEAQPAQEEVQEAPATPEAKQTAKTTKGKTTVKKSNKSEAQIKEELDATGKKLAAQAARTLVPSKSDPQYRQAGKEWIAKYIDVNPDSVYTTMNKSSNGIYVGKVMYTEKVLECRGATKQAALNGSCTPVKNNSRTELITYDGQKWQY